LSRPADLACPVCETEFPANAPHCPRCGLPAAFHEEARRALSTRDPYQRPAPAPAPSRRVAPVRPPARRDREPVEAAIEALDLRVAVLRRLEAPTNEASAEVQRAARSIMHGNSAEAVRSLEAATARAEEAVDGLVDRRLRELSTRRAALEREGFVPPEADERPIRAALAEGHPDAAVDALLALEASTGRFEVGARDLRAPLAEIEELLGLCTQAGVDTNDEREQVHSLRAALSAGPEALGRATERARALADALRHKLPAAILRELERHGTTLEPYPDDHAEAVAARAWHAQALDHLEQGRLSDAASALESLRASIEALGPVPIPPPAPEEAPVPDEALPPEETGPVSIPRLLETARRLAARVRGLPPDSQIANAAALEIRRATAQLRARELEGAEATLNGLLAMLDDTEGVELRGAAP
jgi:hypothetical protein